jgi:16S rRNA (guanine527-N7)-methyltransferase
MILQSEAEARDYCAGLSDANGLDRLERLAAMVVAENARQNLIAKAARRRFGDATSPIARSCSSWLLARASKDRASAHGSILVPAPAFPAW